MSAGDRWQARAHGRAGGFLGNRDAPPLIRAVALFLCLAAPASAAPCTPDRVEARWPGVQAAFGVEVADDAAERAQGLMFRESLPPMGGMLFVYEDERRVAFWMKNTLIPLDMIFADASGRVVRVHDSAVPHDETPISSGAAVRFVLEINGGLSERLGLTEGAELRHPAIDAADAVWPCE